MTKFLSTLFAIILLSIITRSGFAQGIYMELAPGNGTGTAFAGEILLSSVQYSFVNSTTVGSGSGGSGGGRASFSPMAITKQFDPSTASFQKSLFSGGVYQRIRINFYRPITGGGRELAYQVVLGTALISDYNASAAEACSEGCPGLTESIIIQYSQVVTREFVNGTPTRVTTWNVATNNSNVDAFLLATN